MEELIPLIELGMDWKSYNRQFFFWKRPPKDQFLRFMAKKLKDKLVSVPSGISTKIDRAWNNHLYVVGTIQRGDEEDSLEGEIVWMPKLKNFRGHLLVNRPSGEQLLLEEIEELKKQEWNFEKWKPKDPKHTHDHCPICWQSFYETDNEAEGFGHTDGIDWVCQKCFMEHLRSSAS